jgi:hypothetical protein
MQEFSVNILDYNYKIVKNLSVMTFLKFHYAAGSIFPMKHDINILG